MGIKGMAKKTSAVSKGKEGGKTQWLINQRPSLKLASFYRSRAADQSLTPVRVLHAIACQLPRPRSYVIGDCGCPVPLSWADRVLCRIHWGVFLGFITVRPCSAKPDSDQMGVERAIPHVHRHLTFSFSLCCKVPVYSVFVYNAWSTVRVIPRWKTLCTK